MCNLVRSRRRCFHVGGTITDGPSGGFVTLETNRAGGYAFLPGLRFASNGVIALKGMAVDHVAFADPLPFRRGFEAIAAYITERGRPIESLCGVELRLPAALPLDGFVDFNNRYLAQLDAWGLLRDGIAPLARTNVSPHTGAPSEPAVLAFSHTTPDESIPLGYVISGIAELPIGAPYPAGVVRRGESEADAIREKLDCVVEVVTSHVRGLGTAWRPSDDVNLYSSHPIAVTLTDLVLSEAGLTPVHGIRWHRASPPVTELELEIDVRRFRDVRVVHAK